MYSIAHNELEKIVGGVWSLSSLRTAGGVSIAVALPLDGFKTRKDALEFIASIPSVATYDLSNGHHIKHMTV